MSGDNANDAILFLRQEWKKPTPTSNSVHDFYLVEYVGGLKKERRKCIRCGIILCAKNSDKQSFDIDVAMKSFRPTSADPERLFSLTRISRNFLQNRMLPENQARNAFLNKNCYLFN